MNTPVVLITGALTGIGRATALAFAQEGSHVVISGRREDAGRELVTELRALGAQAEFARADVRREDDVRNLVDPGRLGAGPPRGEAYGTIILYRCRRPSLTPPAPA